MQAERMKITANICCYVLAALILPGLFYLLGHILDSLVIYYWPAASQPSENWNDAICDTVCVLIVWAGGDYLLKRKKNKHNFEPPQPEN